MYPFADGQDFVRNAWYIAAWAMEVAEKPLGRTIMEEPIVFYRKPSGDVVAMWGLCGHRNYPLADGKVVGDRIVCPYHGFEFNSQGACVHIPAVAQAPKSFRAKTYPIVEKFQAIWIWMGAEEKADPALIPPLDRAGFAGPGFRALPNGRSYIKARWPLIIDNLMDLSHIGYLHSATFKAPDMGKVKPEFDIGSEYRCVRWMTDQDPFGSYYNRILPDNARLLDAALDTRYFGPGLILTSGVIYTAASCGPREKLASMFQVHGPTPETRTSTHNFSGVARDFLLDNLALDDWHRDFTHEARAEDIDALEKVEQAVSRFGDTTREISGIGDFLGNRLRNHLAGLIRDEQDGEIALHAAE